MNPPGCDAPSPVHFEDGVERLVAAVEGAVSASRDCWNMRLAIGLRIGLDLLASDPPLARLLLVEALEDSELRLAYERSVARLADVLRPPAELTGNEPVSDEILLLQAHGLVSYLSGRVLAGEAERLPEDHEALLRFLRAQLPSDR